MRAIAFAIFTTKEIVGGMAPLLWPILTAIASRMRPATTPSGAIILDLAWVMPETCNSC
jgi:hypothetical protein